MDEVTQEENPDWWPNELAPVKAQYDGSDMSAWAQVTVEVSEDEIRKALYPTPPVVEGAVVSTAGA